MVEKKQGRIMLAFSAAFLCLLAAANGQSFIGSGDGLPADKDAPKQCKVITIRNGYVGDSNGVRARLTAVDIVTERESVTYVCVEGYELAGRKVLTCQSSESFDFEAPRCDPVVCPDPGIPLNGGRRGQRFTFGSQLMFTCDPGYILRGSVRRTCRADKTFSGGPVTCTPRDCGEPGAPDNGGRTLNPNTLYPSTVSFRCNEGYRLQGAISAACQTDGQWSEPVPKCQLVGCCELEAPRNGQKIGQGTDYTQVIGFSCDEGFELVGPQRRTCQAEGSWTGDPVRCEPIMCPVPKTIDNGGYEADRLNVSSVVTFYCDTGYHMAGDRQLTCLPNGQWDKPLPACIVINCGDPGMPENGARQGDDFEFRMAVRFSCNMGYRLLGSPVRFCTADGTWTGTPAFCNLISCGDPGTPTNGNMRSSGSAVGNTVTWNCDIGYRLIGSTDAECQPTGSWSKPTPICERIMCNDPGTPRDASRTGDRVFTPGAAVNLACNTGFLLEGEPDLQCMDSGNWDRPLPVCEEMTCPDPLTPENGFRTLEGVGLTDTVKYQCNPGYTLTGPEERTCVMQIVFGDRPAGLEWSLILPRCEEIECSDPGSPRNGDRQGNDFSFLSTVSFTCRVGYVLEGSPAALCMADKTWSNPRPTCRPVRCPDPGTLENGGRRLAGNMYQDSVMWNCDLSYVLIGQPSAMCRSDGTWSHPKPVCKLAECVDPGVPENGYRRMTTATVGSTVEYFCNDGYVLSGPRARTCLQTRAWSEVPPVCTVVMCPDPLSPVNGGRTGNDFSYAMAVRFHCNEGYRLAGAPVVICLANTTWSDPTPACEVIDCGDPGRITNGRRALSSTTYGSQVGFSCDSGYDLIGNPSALCGLNGRWSSPPPQCIRKPCTDPGTPNFGSRTLEGLRFRDNVQWMCNTGYVMRGLPSAVCQANGQWSNRVPVCEPIRCPDPGTPRFGDRVLEGVIYQNRVDWTCNTGYTLKGSGSAICQADGTWTSPVPSCEPVDCGDPGTPRNGGRVLTTTLLDDRVTFSCNAGYSMDGELEAVCMSTGSWSDPPPRCIIIECPDVSPPANGNRLLTSRIVGSEVTFSCNEGYTLIGVNSALCLLTGRWNDVPPICEIVECGPPPAFLNGAIDYGTTTYKSQARYKCDPGYNLVGANVRDCFANGIWNPEAPTCVKLSCGNPGIPTNGRRVGDDFSYQARVSFQCNANFQMNGPSGAICQADGRWSNPLPQCDPDCTVSEFGSFGSCSVTCGDGTQVSTRSIIQQPSGLGIPCPSLLQSQACNLRPCIQCEDRYPEGAIVYRVTQVDVSSSTRVVIVVDESNSMETEHAWLPDMIKGLQANLLRAGIGTDPSQQNTYSLIGYGRRSPNYVAAFLEDSQGRRVFPSASFEEATRRLYADPEGRIEDGYQAIYYALETLNFDTNPSIANNLIFISDEDRDDTPEGRNVTRSFLKRFLRRGGWLPNVVVDNDYTCQSQKAIGVDSTLTAFLPTGSGDFQRCTSNTEVGRGYATTRRDYTSLALELKGAAWDINVLREGGSSSASFTNAFTDVKTKEILRATEQCQRCVCRGVSGSEGSFSCLPDAMQPRCNCIADGGTWNTLTTSCDNLPEAQPCILSNWTPWGSCSATCGIGSQRRTRTIVQEPDSRADRCDSLSEVTTCSLDPCPIDCRHPGTPANGQTRPVDTVASYRPGTIATFACNVGYFLQGAERATCLPSGRWDRPTPVCIALGCTPGAVTYKAADGQSSLAADVFLVIDQSRSMEGEIAWLPNFVANLEIDLQSKGIGITSGCPNLYSITGYGRSSPNEVGNVFTTPGDNLNCFPSDRFNAVHRQVQADNEGRVEDGYEAIYEALSTVVCSRRNSCPIGRNMILISDEDRDIVNASLTTNSVRNLLLNRGFILNVVVDNTFSAYGFNALGVDSENNAFIEQPRGEFRTESRDVVIGPGYASTKRQYTDLALNINGGAWDINILRLGENSAASFSSAIVEIKAQEILDQLRGCQQCTCSRIGTEICIPAQNQLQCVLPQQ